jgi:hypothetical protein
MATISSLTNGGVLQGTDKIPVARILSGGSLGNVNVFGSDVVRVAANGGLTKNTSGELTLAQGLTQGYNFIPAKFNDINPYSGRVLDTFTATRANNGAYTSPTQTVTVCPVTGNYSASVAVAVNKIEAFLIKIKAQGVLQRQEGNINMQFRRNGSETWAELFDIPAGGSAGGWRVNESSTEIIYHNPTTGTFDWRISDPATTTVAGTVSYTVEMELLGFYFKVD